MTKLIPLVGLLRSELNIPLDFANVKEGNRGSIYRRSLVVGLKAKFPPRAEYALLGEVTAEAIGVYPKGDSLKDFLESRPEAAAFLKFIFEFVNTFTMRGSSGIIDDYARGGRNYVAHLA